MVDDGPKGKLDMLRELSQRTEQRLSKDLSYLSVYAN